MFCLTVVESCWSPVRTLPVAPLWCDLGFVPNSRGNKAAANLRPREQEMNKIGVIMPFMGHVYKVLSVLIKQHMNLLYERYGMSQRFRVENFHFEVTDDHLAQYQRTWVHYQNALQIVYTKQHHGNPEHERTRFVKNPAVDPQDPRQARTAFIPRGSPDNPDQVLPASVNSLSMCQVKSRADKEIILQYYNMLNTDVRMLMVVMGIFMEIFLIPLVREWVLERTLK